MKKKILIIFLFLFIYSVSVFGDTTYQNYGGNDKNFFSSLSSRFNSNDYTQQEVVDIVYIPDSLKSPLVEDLNNDGIKEVIVLSKSYLHILNLSESDGVIEFNFIDSFFTGNTETNRDYFSNIVLYDIDEDGKKEIIFHSQENHQLFMLGFNDTHLVNESSVSVYTNFIAPNYPSANSVISCGHSNGCIIAFNDRSNFDAVGSRDLNVYVFNSTEWFSSYHNKIHNGGTKPYCFQREQSVIYANNFYYLLTTMNQDLFLTIFDLNTTHAITQTQKSLSYFNNYGAGSCGEHYDGVTDFSSITPVNFVGDSSIEVGFGYNNAYDTFKMSVYTENGVLSGTYPVIDSAGILISNPFVANVFSDTPNNDLCIMGYDAVAETLEALCSSQKTSNLAITTQSTEYTLDFPSPPFVVNSSYLFPFIIHHTESDDSNSIGEFLTPYGVFTIEDYSKTNLINSPGCYLAGRCDMEELIYDSPINEAHALILVDYFDDGFDDIIYLSENHIGYLDDGFTNQNAYLEYCTKIDPNPQNWWRLHTNESNQSNNIRVTARVTDPNGDIVSSMVSLYVGEKNEHNSTWLDRVSGSPDTHDGIFPNETTSGSILRIYYKDIINYNDSPNYQDYDFKVRYSGDARGDSHSCVGVTPEEYEDGLSLDCIEDDDCGIGEVCNINSLCEVLDTFCTSSADCPVGYFCIDNNCTLESDADNNAITNSLQGFSVLLGVPLIVLVLIIFGAISYGVFKEQSIHNNIKLPVIIILNLFGLGIALYLGLISVLWLVILVILVIALISVIVIRVVGR